MRPTVHYNIRDDISLNNTVVNEASCTLTFDIVWDDVKKGTLFVGVYNDKDVLVGMNHVNLTNTDTSTTVTVEYTSEPKFFKAFMWDNPTDMESVLDMCNSKV